MKDLKKTDIEDIERQMHNYRVFSAFLKKHNLYRFFRKKMFSDFDRTPLDLMRTITNDFPTTYMGSFSSCLNNRIDKRWAVVFIYVPYYGGYWYDNLHTEVDRLSGIKNMSLLSNIWQECLKRNNYDKMKESDDSTFTLE